MPAGSGRGRLARASQGEREARAGGDLPTQARRCGLQGRRSQHAAARVRRRGQREAHRARRRGTRVADGCARSRAAGLHVRGVRPRSARRRHDAHADPEVSPARRGDRRGGRLRARPRHRISRRRAHRQPARPARAGLRRGLRGERRTARPRPRHSRPQGSGEEHPHRHRLALVGFVRARQQDRQARGRARRRQHGDGLLPQLAASGRRGSERRGALGLRRDEGVPVGEGRRDARGHPDPQLPRAAAVPP